MSDRLDINWASPGPVSTAFMNSTANIQIINGPIGGGKTTTAFMKGIQIGRQQMPSKTRTINIGDGNRKVRKVKMCVVRDTYRQLHKTTIPSWHKRFPAEMGEWIGAADAPCKHRLHFLLPDGSVLDFIAEFAAIGDNNVEDFMRGFEPTFWMLNELDLLSREVLVFARGRSGRYPDMSEGGPTWHGVLADCNAPELEGWMYREVFEKTPDELKANGIELFVQPGGLDPAAENVENLPKGYYSVQMAGQPDWYQQRFIHNRAGYSRAGKPVHPEFKDHLHMARTELQPIPGLSLTIGIDPRTFPSAVFVQKVVGGQSRVLDECQGEQNMGARRFGKLLADMLNDRFPYHKPEQIRGRVDPSATYGADKEGDEKNWLEIVSEVSGIRIDPAPTNSIDYRREALKKPLMELIDGQPAILISPRCKKLRQALNSGFRYKKLNVSGAERFSEDVEKNEFADMAEAAEYAMLDADSYAGIAERKSYTSTSIRTARMRGEMDDARYDPLGRL